MVKIFLGVTHKPWFDYLAGISPDEVNFWQPSGSSEFKALQPGDLFLFKLKGADAAIAGGGVFGHPRPSCGSSARKPTCSRSARSPAGTACSSTSRRTSAS